MYDLTPPLAITFNVNGINMRMSALMIHGFALSFALSANTGLNITVRAESHMTMKIKRDLFIYNRHTLFILDVFTTKFRLLWYLLVNAYGNRHGFELIVLVPERRAVCVLLDTRVRKFVN